MGFGCHELAVYTASQVHINSTSDARRMSCDLAGIESLTGVTLCDPGQQSYSLSSPRPFFVLEQVFHCVRHLTGELMAGHPNHGNPPFQKGLLPRFLNERLPLPWAPSEIKVIR